MKWWVENSMRKKDEENKGEKIKRALHEGLVSVELLPLQLREVRDFSPTWRHQKHRGPSSVHIPKFPHQKIYKFFPSKYLIIQTN